MIRIDNDHNEEYWKKPDKFNSDRCKENSFIMFEGGLRICLRIKLAIIELVCLMVYYFENMKLI
jgi:cytochrome P450